MVTILISEPTAERLGEDFATRRLLQLGQRDSSQALQVFELAADKPANWADMKRRYEAALALDEEQPAWRAALARALLEHGLAAEAVTALLEAVALDGTNIALRVALADAQGAAGDTNAAIRTLQEYISLL